MNVSDSNHSVTPPVDGGEGRHSTGLTAEHRRRRARSAAHASWANTTDRAARTSPGTAAFLDRFERQVDPEGKLPDEVCAQMARHARLAYMLSLAERSAKARRSRANQQR